jgi:hypothetical protein
MFHGIRSTVADPGVRVRVQVRGKVCVCAQADQAGARLYS